MGGCFGNQKIKKPPLEAYDQEPSDTQMIYSENLPKLAFQALLTNVKIKSCQYQSLSIKFSIDKVEQFILTRKEIQQRTAKWRIQHKFGFIMTEYQLRKQFLKIEFLDPSDIVVGTLKINLYIISTGPYHLDFSVPFQNTTYGRISFDLKISQIIQVNLQCNRAEVDLHKKHPGQRFSFSIQSLIDNARIFSKPSYSIRIKLDNRETDDPSIIQVNTNVQKKKILKAPQKQMQVDKNLIWEQGNSKLYIPSLTIAMQASDLHHGCFRILVWKLNDENYKKQHLQQEDKLEFYGDCYISFQNIFLQTYKIIQKEERKMEYREIQIGEKLWSHGREMGKANFKFTIQNQSYIKQMYICVRTQQGILKSAPVFDIGGKGKKSTSSQCQQIKALIKLSESIQSKILQLEKKQVSNYQSRMLQISIQNDLARMSPLLSKTSKQSFLFYNYNSKRQLMYAQSIFIDVGLKIFNYIQQDDPHISQMCWLVLISLLKRGEFMLSHIGFSQQEKQLILKNKIDQQLRQRIEIALHYQQFLYKLLQFALNALNVKGLDCQRSFAEIFCAFAYFRIPKFRDQLLKAICHRQDQQIIQLASFQIHLKDETKYLDIQESVNTFTILFDWKSYFHAVLEKEEKYKLNNSQLADILSNDNSEWRVRMGKRGSAFFYFLNYWVNYVEDIAVKSRDIQWKYFPGYNRLMKSFLVELKKRSILEYPDAMKITCEKLLCNEKMLNPFVTILLGKANINQPLTILKAITMISSLFSTLEKKNRKIPHTFNYILFFKAIKIVIMQTDFSYGISQVLCMLYNHYDLFQKNFRLNIALFLLGKAFFRLFLFWSQNVRDIFYHLILMRIYNQSLQIHQENSINAKTKHQYNQQIRMRFEKLMTILETQERNRDEENRSKIGLIFEKEYYKKMRKKLNKKNRKTSEQVLFDSMKHGAQTQKYKKMISTDGQFFDKGQLHRTNSAVLQPEIIQLINNFKHHPSEVVISCNKHSDIQSTKNIYHSNISQEHEFQLFLDENDSEFGTIKPILSQYIPISMSSYREVKKNYENIIRQKKGQFPNVKMEMPIDNKQLRPDKIDNL